MVVVIMESIYWLFYPHTSYPCLEERILSPFHQQTVCNHNQINRMELVRHKYLRNKKVLARKMLDTNSHSRISNISRKFAKVKNFTFGTPKPTLPPVALILSLGSNFSPESKERRCLNSAILAIRAVYVCAVCLSRATSLSFSSNFPAWNW